MVHFSVNNTSFRILYIHVHKYDNNDNQVIIYTIKSDKEVCQSNLFPNSVGLQNMAAGFTASNYSYKPGSMTNILWQLKWGITEAVMDKIKLIVLYMDLKDQAKMPTFNLVSLQILDRKQHLSAFHRNEYL